MVSQAEMIVTVASCNLSLSLAHTHTVCRQKGEDEQDEEGRGGEGEGAERAIGDRENHMQNNEQLCDSRQNSEIAAADSDEQREPRAARST